LFDSFKRHQSRLVSGPWRLLKKKIKKNQRHDNNLSLQNGKRTRAERTERRERAIESKSKRESKGARDKENTNQ